MSQSNVLVIADDAAFARAIVARWQTERCVPIITQASSDVSESAALEAYQLVILGPVRRGALELLVREIENVGVAVCVCSEGDEGRSLAREFPGLVFVPLQDGWLDALLLISREVLRRLEAEARSRQAERTAAIRGLESTLGRYMIEMKHAVNDALTSLLGNADLLLLAPDPLSPQSRDQIRTIRLMALRLNEIMQRFSSLATEIGAAEKESHSETSKVVSLRSSDV